MGETFTCNSVLMPKGSLLGITYSAQTTLIGHLFLMWAKYVINATYVLKLMILFINSVGQIALEYNVKKKESLDDIF